MSIGSLGWIRGLEVGKALDNDGAVEATGGPDRAFHGSEQVHENWSLMFSGVPDFRSEQLRSVVEGDTVWTEWHWSGTHADGMSFAMRGVTIFGVRDAQLVWGRLYMEPVQQTGAGIDAQMQRWAHGDPPETKWLDTPSKRTHP
jgi:hypothetical protein